MEPKYLKRIADSAISRKLRLFGAVVVEGAKLTGKSTSCRRLAETVFEFQDPEKSDYYALQVANNPKALLDNPSPILFDEWQDNHRIWDVLRLDVDKRMENGRYLLTGSANIKKDDVMHTGTGRFAFVKMRPMSLYESEDSNGTVSLENLFDGRDNIFSECHVSIEKLAYLTVRGGFPKTVGLDEEDSKIIMNEYYSSLIRERVASVDGIRRDPQKLNGLIKSYSRNISTYASDVTIMNDMSGEGTEINKNTYGDYKNALERLYIIENVEAWATSIRSKSAIRKSSKKALVDTSIACSALRLSSDKLLRDLRYFGFLFEALCIRDLRIYAESIDGHIYNYREEKGFEIDVVIELADGRWGGVEVKLGADKIDEAAENLLKLKEKVDTDKKGCPSFLMVLYGGKYNYKREDGILVASIASLKN